MEKIIAAIKKCGTEIKIPIEQEKEHSKKRTKLAQLKARQDIFIGKVKTMAREIDGVWQCADLVDSSATWAASQIVNSTVFGLRANNLL